jgi:hypothetical protein
MIGAAVDDPKRPFATINFRIAKGLLDPLISCHLHDECTARPSDFPVLSVVYGGQM